MKEVRIILDRIDSNYFRNSEMTTSAKMHEGSDKGARSFTSAQANISLSTIQTDIGENKTSDDVRDTSQSHFFKETSSLVEELQDHLTSSNGDQVTGEVTTSVNSRMDIRDDSNFDTDDANYETGDQQSSGKLTGAAPPSSSRPVSPVPRNEYIKQDCFVKLKRLNMSNLRFVMQKNCVRSVSVPACFLHLKDNVTKMNPRSNSNNHYVLMVDEGICFKVISMVQSLEIFHIDKDQVRHNHLSIDVCRCPFSRKFKVLRGWTQIKNELSNGRKQISSNVYPSIGSRNIKKHSRVVGKQIHLSPKIKSTSKLVSEHMDETDRSKSYRRVQELENNMWPSIKSKTKDNHSEIAVIGKVRSLETLPQENMPGYTYHQPGSPSTYRTNTEAEIPCTLPPNNSRITASTTRESENIDIFSVKGLIKQRKGEVSNSKEFDLFNLNNFHTEPGEYNFRSNEHLVADSLLATNECDIQPNLLSEEFSRCPLFNNSDFLKLRTEEVDKLTEASEDLLVNTYYESRAEKNAKELASLSEIEKTIRVDKRKLEPENSGSKRPRLDREKTLPESSVSVNIPVETIVTTAEPKNTPGVSTIMGHSLRLKDKALLMATEKELASHYSSDSSERVSDPPSCSRLWPRRIERRQKRISKRRELFLKERQERMEQTTGFRQLSVSKLMGVALNQYPSHIDISRTFNLDMVQQIHSNQNRILSLTKEGASEEPVRVVDDQLSEASQQVWVRKKTPEERSNLVKSLSRLHQQHAIFIPSPPPSIHKTEQRRGRRYLRT